MTRYQFPQNRFGDSVFVDIGAIKKIDAAVQTSA